MAKRKEKKAKEEEEQKRVQTKEKIDEMRK